MLNGVFHLLPHLLLVLSLWRSPTHGWEELWKEERSAVPCMCAAMQITNESQVNWM